LRSLAEAWNLGIIAVDPAAMQGKASQALTVSNRVQGLRGVPSVCETAALAGAGSSARLLCARVTSGGAAAAIARGESCAP
jgi:cobalt-precorrin 5A hydrolase